VGRLSVQESPSLEQPPERDAPEERGNQDTRRPIRGSGKGRARALLSTGDPVTWARRMKMRSTPDPAPPGATVLWGNRGGGNVVIWRDLPTGKGERPSSHTPEPEDVNQVVGGRLGFVPGRTPRTRILTSPHLSIWKKKEIHLVWNYFSVRKDGEESRRIRKAFVRRQRRKREPEGGPDRRPARRMGNRSRRTSHPTDLIVVCDVISDTEGT